MLIGTLLASLVGSYAEAEIHLAQLLNGVEQVAIPSGAVPGPFSVHGERAFPVAAGQADRGVQAPVAAAALTKNGRAVAFGHGGYLSQNSGQILLNAVRWAANNRPGKIAVAANPALADHLEQNGVPTERARTLSALGNLDRFAAVCIDAHHLDERGIQTLQAYIENGGGLVTAGLAWGWLQLNRGKTIHQHPGNRLLGKYGILWADGYLQNAPLSENIGALHARTALQTLQTGSANEKRQADWIVALALRTLSTDDASYRPEVEKLLSAANKQPSPNDPLTSENALDRLALTRDLLNLENTPPEKIQPHPAAKFFPGEVPADAETAPPTAVSVPLNIHGWRSTGLYAPPGALVKIETTAEAATYGLKVRIGAHTDRIWHKPEWKRAPQIATAAPIDAAAVQTANAFGGLIYIDVPRGLPAKTIQTTVSGAVLAPHFVLGKTDLNEWRESIRLRPAPWAELETKRIILTVRSEAVRNLDDPDETMRFWNRVMEACEQLASEPQPRTRPERIVPDTQISAGYMHAGYPIMTHLDVEERSLDPAQLMKGSWGHYHELGHNFQSSNWTFNGTVEVTCNLFTLYVYEKVCGIPLHEARDTLSAERIVQTAQQHVKNGAPFDKWKSDPFLALTMYAQMIEAFGWEPFQEAFTGYESPIRNDQEKRNQWMIRFSNAVGRNLGPFFEAWGVPTNKSARESLKGMPVWLPAPFQESSAR